MFWESSCSGSAPRNSNVANAAPGVSNLPKAEVVERCSQAGLFRVEAVTLDLRAPTRLELACSDAFLCYILCDTT